MHILSNMINKSMKHTSLRNEYLIIIVTKLRINEYTFNIQCRYLINLWLRIELKSIRVDTLMKYYGISDEEKLLRYFKAQGQKDVANK